MLFGRFVFAMALVMAALASQAPEFVQQYEQRLGGAIDELRADVARFDQEASNQALSREAAIARLEANSDALAEARGRDIAADVVRLDGLQRQREALATAGPVARYAILVESLDSQVAAGAYADFAPAMPITTGGLVAAVTGFLGSWLLMHGVAQPFRRRRLHRPAERREA